MVGGHDAAAGTCPTGHCGWTAPQLSGASSPQPAQVLNLLLLPPLIFQGSSSRYPELATEMDGLVWRRNAKALAQKKLHPSESQTQAHCFAVPPQQAARDRSFQDQNPAECSCPVGWWLMLTEKASIFSVRFDCDSAEPFPPFRVHWAMPDSRAIVVKMRDGFWLQRISIKGPIGAHNKVMTLPGLTWGVPEGLAPQEPHPCHVKPCASEPRTNVFAVVPWGIVLGLPITKLTMDLSQSIIEKERI